MFFLIILNDLLKRGQVLVAILGFDGLDACNQAVELLLLWVFRNQALNEEFVIPGARHFLCAKLDQLSGRFSVLPLSLFQLLLLVGFGLLCLFGDALLLLFQGFDGILALLSLLDLRILLCRLGGFLGLRFLLLHLLDARVLIISGVDELHNTFPVLLQVLLLTLLVLLLHPPSLVPVSRVLQIKFIVLAELTPCLEVVPELIEGQNLFDRRVFIAKLQENLVDRKARVVVESLREQFVKVLRGDIIGVRNRLIERQA